MYNTLKTRQYLQTYYVNKQLDIDVNLFVFLLGTYIFIHHESRSRNYCNMYYFLYTGILLILL